VLVIALGGRFWLSCKVTSLCGEREVVLGGSSTQFGILQLMILTTLCAFLIAIGRVVLKKIPNEELLFGFLSLASVLICIPVLFSILSERHFIVKPSCMILIGVLLTYWQVPLLAQVKAVGARPNWLDIAAINGFAVLQILVFAGTLRWAGYGFAVAHSDR
jgi:hypothetical protein